MSGGAGEPDTDAEPAELPFRQVAQKLPSPCWISDAEGRIVWANDAWVGYTGMTPPMIQAEGLRRLHQPGSYERVRQDWIEAKSDGSPVDITFPLRGRDGRFRPFRTIVTPLRNARGVITRWFGVNTDLSAQAGAEDRFRELFERAGEATFVISAEGLLTEANAAASELTQHERSELVGRPFADLLRTTELGASESAKAGEAPAPALALRRKDDTWLDVEVSSSELSDGGRLAIVRDISDRRRIEQAWTASEARYRQLVGEEAAKAAEAQRQLQRFWDASRDLLAIISLADGRPTMLNQDAWLRTLGYPADALKQTRLVDLTHPEDRERTMALNGAMRSGADVHGFENRYRHADGRWVWLSWNVVREGGMLFAIARDITLEIEAKQALSHSERQFRLLVAGVVDYALFMLSPEGIVTNWNAGAERIKGYRADEILGRHLSVFYTEADRAAGVPQEVLAAAREHGRYEAEAWRVRKGGDLFWANVVIDAIRDETGQLVGFAKITRDMSEQREAQLELQRAQERLAQAQKLEAVGQLTGGVAHDFNNILMVVGGQTELLRRYVGDDNPAAVRALDAIEQSARRGQDLTRHLLAFARRSRLNPAPIELPKRRSALQHLLSASVGSLIQVTLDLPDDLWCVEADANELELALLNMAVNARDAMPDGGRIVLQAHNVALGAGDQASEAAGDFVAITVRDEGGGIPPDILPKVFEPFFTTKAVDKGTGLGLSQVYGFVQQSGGRVQIESELGRGTAITLFLPRVEASEGREAEATHAKSVGAVRSAYVLLVEDNPQVADVASRLLDQLGHRTQVAASAEAALALFEAGARPELVFSDVVMAGRIDGLDLARRIREHWPEIPVLLATGYSEAADRMPKREFPIIPKPYGLAELSRAIDAALRTKAPA
ncbi:MAG TPA: PAS domain S-box protein [Caulobacteraceae bacterium]|nr:PAS domain S-box protein [Caulobacteraceae bacterium]